MDIILKVDQRKSEDVNISEFDVYVIQGQEMVLTEGDLIQAMNQRLPAMTGVFQAQKIMGDYWVVKSKN